MIASSQNPDESKGNNSTETIHESKDRDQRRYDNQEEDTEISAQNFRSKNEDGEPLIGQGFNRQGKAGKKGGKGNNPNTVPDMANQTYQEIRDHYFEILEMHHGLLKDVLE